MRKEAVLLAVLLVASAPAVAMAKSHKKSAAKPAPAAAAEPEDLNANTKKLLRDGWPLILPTSLQVLYFSTHPDAGKSDADKPAKHKKK